MDKNTAFIGQMATGTEGRERWDSAAGGSSSPDWGISTGESSSPSWGSGFFNNSRNFAGTIGFGGGTGASLEFGMNTVGDVSTVRKEILDKYLTEYPVEPLVPSELVTATRRPLLIPAEPCHVSRDTERLPAYKNKTAITDAIRDYKVILITGGTGCGKTTQVQQFIMEEARLSGKKIQILCTFFCPRYC